MKIPYEAVKSSNVAQIAFVKSSPAAKVGTLYMEFIGGRRYAHGGVTQKQFDELMMPGASIGSLYAKNIKGKNPIEFRGARCNASPCQNDATKQTVIAGTTVYVCDECAKTAPQLRLIKFAPAVFAQGPRS